MGLFKKIKDILYDEEEYTEQIKITPEMRNEQIPDKVEAPKEIREVSKPVQKEEQVKTVERESDLFTKNNSFPFDFDEEEFKQVNKPAPKPEPPKPIFEHHSSNVLEIERKKKVERRTDYGRYEKTEITETTERKRFKPSPIISPVYGILNQDYSKGDIIQREDSDKMDIQSVRNKAFGEKKEIKKEVPVKEEKPATTYYQESETVTITEPSEKEKKVKTIDELLENTSDVVASLDNELTEELQLIEDELDLKPKLKETSDKEEKIEEPTEEMPTPTFEDTLENDLFNLIDSMYDNKEEGDE